MAGAPGLTRWLLLALVLGAHALALDWLGGQLAASSSVLRKMAPPMFTRLLQPEAPPVVVAAAPSPIVQARPRPTARAVPAKPVASQAKAPEAPPEAPPEPPLAQTPVAAASAPAAESAPPPAPASDPPAEQAAAADPPASAPEAPAAGSWPGDTRLTYRLGGKFRSGDLYGDARVQWQREGERYQVRVDIDVTLFATLVMTSQGIVTPQGLLPRAYEEQTSRRRRSALLGETALVLEKGQVLPRPPGVQDTASQFVELGHRFATGQEALEVGRSISFWMARPGGLDHWTYDVVALETLQTPSLGTVEAFRLKPRPLANPRGNITAEMWFAPSLQYLPVRIVVSMGREAQVDLLVDRIEQ